MNKREEAMWGRPITIEQERDGKKYIASYRVCRGRVPIVEVYLNGLHKGTQVGNSPASAVASLLLSDLITEYNQAEQKVDVKGSNQGSRG